MSICIFEYWMQRFEDLLAEAYEELCNLSQIKAEVNYRELGIDDGAETREQEQLSSGSVRRAVIRPATSGGGSPGPSSLVFLHMTFSRDDGEGTGAGAGTGMGAEEEAGPDADAAGVGHVVASTRKEHGGSGVPCMYRLNEGRWRPVRGLEIALLEMLQGERSLVVTKPSMCFLHEDVEDSWMARALRPCLEGDSGASHVSRPAHETYRSDVELLAWIDDVVAVDLASAEGVEGAEGKAPGRVAFKRITADGTGWETPREPFSVSVRMTQQPVEQYGRGDGAPQAATTTTTSAEEETIECEIGDGRLPKDLEAVICTMRKGEDAVVLCPAPEPEPGPEPSPTRPMPQDAYVQYRVSLLDMTQARDLMGDGKTMKKITKKGEGEFPIDCPMEDARVVLRTKIRRKDSASADAAALWMPLMASSLDAETEVATGMGELPPVVDAAVRLMLKGEVSVLTADVDDTIRELCERDGAHAFSVGDRVEVEIELVRFDSDGARPVQLLEPEEKLVRARQFKEDGNFLYKKGRFHLARSKYNKAINCVGKLFEFSEADVDEACSIKTSSTLNLAACAHSTGSYSEAIQWCERVLEDDSQNTKALFRRNKALVGLARFDEALADLDALITIDPSLSADVSRERAIVRRKIKEADAKQRRQFGSFLLKDRR